MRPVLLLCLLSLPLAAQQPCKALKSLGIPAASIALPTTGVTITSAQQKSTFCQVQGRIHPVDPNAQDIRFHVNLPNTWNGKAVHYGGGAFDGWLAETNGLRQPTLALKSQPTPLERGFATFGSDSGHHKRYFLLPDVLNAVNARFALNDETRRNYAQDALKKTHDAAVAVLQAHYAKPPSRMFFLGGSTGGREAYFVVQRWPNDYDGVLGAFAGWDQVELDLQFIRVSQAMYGHAQNGASGFLSKPQTTLLARSVLQSCDNLDGLEDGLISNPDTCHFDPATLLCTAHQQKGCLTPTQLHTVQTFATEQRTAQPLMNGVQTMPGFNVLAGADLTGNMGLLHHAEHPPRPILNSFYYLVGDQVLRFFLTRDPHFNALTFDTTTGGKFASRLLPESQASDASISDLSPFAAHGGKFLIVHGTADATIPTNASVLYYQMLLRNTPAEALDKSVRFYLIPGFGHGHGTFNAGFDSLAILDHWLDGTAPTAALTVTDNNPTHRTRPLCAFPTYPRYNGSGDPNAAASFTCTAPEQKPHTDSPPLPLH